MKGLPFKRSRYTRVVVATGRWVVARAVARPDKNQRGAKNGSPEQSGVRGVVRKNSKNRWSILPALERREFFQAYLDTNVSAGRVHDLHFHDLRHTFTTWLTQCGVDYAVIQTLKGEPLPGSAKYYIHNWNARLRDAVTRLEAFTKAVLSGENDVQVPVTATCLWVRISKYAKCGAEGQNRTVDTSLFRAVLYQLSYLGTEWFRSFSAGLFPHAQDQPTPGASYQGRTSDFHIFRVYWVFLLVHMIHDDS
jgi:Phage integrase family